MEGRFHDNIQTVYDPGQLGPSEKNANGDADSIHKPEPTGAGSKNPLVEPKEDSDPAQQSGKFYLLLPFRLLIIFISLYFFICSLHLLSSSFRLLGGRAASQIFSDADLLQNPVVDVVIGILATVLVQSSSTSTSIIVSLVTAGSEEEIVDSPAFSVMTVRQAIPMIMGANIGTSVTNTIVALSQIGNRDDFRRAFTGATIHDMFNWLCVIVLLPVEMATRECHPATRGIDLVASDLVRLQISLTMFRRRIVRRQNYLERVSDLMTRNVGTQDAEVQLLSAITDPFVDRIVQIDKNVLNGWAENDPYYNNASLLKHCTGDSGESCCYFFSDTGMSDAGVGGLLLVLSLGLMIYCLLTMVNKLNLILQGLRSLGFIPKRLSFTGTFAAATKKYVNADLPGVPWLTGYVAIVVGAGMTFLVQSSSVFTSTLTPLVGIGVISVERMYPLTLGSNIGTTSTAILAAMAADGDKLKPSLQAAFCHLLFNVTGILLFYVVPFMRFPIPLAKILGETTAKYRWFAAIYLLIMFCLFPLLVFLLSLAGIWVLLGVGGPFLLVLIAAVVINILQRKRPDWLPPVLKNWKFLPRPLHSLEPYDTFMMRLPCCGVCRKAAEASEEAERFPV
ncbi:unnamed protein product [Darwinula stevensoni]|uniref:Uncharacterized protein n=1 Tax=Darwinula stevensoni TaxID=69355 RepID=A0A7R9FQJ9_9CRUS|nr:unnamed protein product [Darwinula stevensoni]CAG0899938.1 unnamed protein product [Darwinula stevensoni]